MSNKPESEQWVDSVEVMTEYERGRQDGIKYMQTLADEVLKRSVADELEIEALKARVEDLKARGGPAQQVSAPPPVVAWECTDERFVRGIVTTSHQTVAAWDAGGIQYAKLGRIANPARLQEASEKGGV